MTHICVSKITVIGSDNGSSPGRRQAIIWTSVGILLIGPLGTNFSEILIEIYTFSFKKMHLKMSSGKWRPFCLGLNVLKERHPTTGAMYILSVWHSVYGHVIKYLRYSHHCFTFTFLVGSSKKGCDTTSVQSVDHPTDITNKHQPSRSLLSLLPKEPQQVILNWQNGARHQLCRHQHGCLASLVQVISILLSLTHWPVVDVDVIFD